MVGAPARPRRPPSRRRPAFFRCEAIVSVVESESTPRAWSSWTVHKASRRTPGRSFPPVSARRPSGPTLSGQNAAGDTLTLSVSAPAARSHEFLITMARPMPAHPRKFALTAFPEARERRRGRR